MLELTTEERGIGADEDDVSLDANTSLLSLKWLMNDSFHEIAIYTHI